MIFHDIKNFMEKLSKRFYYLIIYKKYFFISYMLISCLYLKKIDAVDANVVNNI